MVYGIVMYDFVVEWVDELEVKVGEVIIVIVQFNFEWFVVKFIGRFGGFGLIFVFFVEICDMVSDKVFLNFGDVFKKVNIFKVEEWKKMVVEYKNSSIMFGKFEGGVNLQGVMEQGMDCFSL